MEGLFLVTSVTLCVCACIRARVCVYACVCVPQFLISVFIPVVISDTILKTECETLKLNYSDSTYFITAQC